MADDMKSQQKIPASVYIICCNSARTIRDTLESVKEFDEIVVVDSGSTDNTLQIAAEYGCRVYSHPWQGYARQKMYALSLCTNEWVLNLDSDEIVSPVLKDEIRSSIAANDADGLAIAIRDVFMGRLNHPWVRTNRQIRFFKRSKGAYEDVGVHESVKLSGSVKKSKGYLVHRGVPDLQTMIEKNNLYSSLRAQDKFKKGKKPSLVKLVFVFPLMFIKSYLLKRHVFNGYRGLIVAVNSAFYAFLKEAKLFELYQSKNGDD